MCGEGLGNYLFKIAAATMIANKLKTKKLVFDKTITSPHSTINYFETIFKNFNFEQPSPYTNFMIISNYDSYIYHDWVTMLKYTPFSIKIKNYCQHWKYITREFIEKLNFNTTIVDKYPFIYDKVFIHIRGGDYLFIRNLPDLTNYYKKALKCFPEDTEYVLFTNDYEYAMTKDWLPKNIIVIHENEIDTLYLMSKCKGGITANSTFSWWGAFLNPNRTLTVPSHFFSNDKIAESFHFPTATVIDLH